MFLEEFFASNEGERVSKLAKESSTFNRAYAYWRDSLFERIMRLFVWEGTDTEKDGIKPKEIEQRLILQGHVGITKIPNIGLSAMFGSFYGVTQYLDEWKHYTVRSPIHSGQRTIGKDIVVINNNSLRNPAYNLIHHYAILLGHTEVTLVNTLVNARDAGGIPVVTTEKQKQSVISYQNRIFNGQYGTITDIGNIGLEFAGADRKTQQSIMDIIILREKLLKSFYSDIGVRSAFEKRSNSIEAEVEADTSLLLLNLADMIECRKKGAEEVNAMFNTNWSVHIAKEIDYGTENERTQFDSVTETHTHDTEVGEDNAKIS